MRVLVLGGTSEGSALAAMLHQTGLVQAGRFAVTLSLAGATRTPMLPAVPHRIGGFGGAEGLAAWLRAQRIETLVDASHPFAARMRAHAAVAAAQTGTILLRIARPAWIPQAGDPWTQVADAQAAAACLGAVPRRVLLTVGSRSLAPFRDTPAHRYVVRCIDAPDPSLLPAGAELLLARGPFTLAGETDLLERRRIEILVSKNSGGEATAAKLHAARRLGVEVVMIARPPELADTPSVATAAEALEFLSALAR